jgi:hypothetical protein
MRLADCGSESHTVKGAAVGARSSLAVAYPTQQLGQVKPCLSRLPGGMHVLQPRSGLLERLHRLITLTQAHEAVAKNDQRLGDHQSWSITGALNGLLRHPDRLVRMAERDLRFGESCQTPRVVNGSRGAGSHFPLRLQKQLAGSVGLVRARTKEQSSAFLVQAGEVSSVVALTKKSYRPFLQP